jgi:hypothetical protein
MRTRLAPITAIALGLAAALTFAPLVAQAAEPAAPATAAKAGDSPRAPDATEKAAMLEVLKPETAPARAAWLSYTAGNAESRALAESLGTVFREAGWKVETAALAGLVLKPGVSLLIADEQPPTWVETAVQALGKSGVDVKTASGYRSYYDEKKAENPAWPGVPLAKDAAFVIVVGPEPKA